MEELSDRGSIPLSSINFHDEEKEKARELIFRVFLW